MPVNWQKKVRALSRKKAQLLKDFTFCKNWRRQQKVRYHIRNGIPEVTGQLFYCCQFQIPKLLYRGFLKINIIDMFFS